MQDDVVYNQIITFAGDGVRSGMVARSYVEEGKLTLVLDDGGKVLVDGRNVDTIDHKDRILAIIEAARIQGIEIESKAVTHYASSREGDAPAEYVLVKW